MLNYLKLRNVNALRVHRWAGTREVFDNANNLVGVAELIVVPNVQHEVLASSDRG